MEDIPGRVRSFFSWWMPPVWVTVTLAAYFAIEAQVGGQPFVPAIWAGVVYTAVIVFAVKMTALAYRLFRRAVRGPEDSVPVDEE